MPLLTRIAVILGMSCPCLLLSPVATAGETGGISLNQTRVIFNASDKMQTLTIRNRSDKPHLIQARTLLAQEGGNTAPFTVTPPLFRLEAGGEQTVRILFNNAPVPPNVESLFYLSLRAIPAAKEQAASPSQVVMGLNFTLKLFYRPASLGVAPETQQCNLRFRRSVQGVQIENPTPYHVTLRALTIDGTRIADPRTPMMLAPFASETLPTTRPSRQVQWQTINDHGGINPSCQHALSQSETL